MPAEGPCSRDVLLKVTENFISCIYLFIYISSLEAVQFIIALGDEEVKSNSVKKLKEGENPGTELLKR